MGSEGIDLALKVIKGEEVPDFTPIDGILITKIEKVNGEFLASIMARPDQWTSHYNMGNDYLNRIELKQAVASYDKALKLEPRAVMAMVDSSLLMQGWEKMIRQTKLSGTL